MNIQFVCDKTMIEITPRISFWIEVMPNYVIRRLTIGWIIFRVGIEFDRKRDFNKEKR